MSRELKELTIKKPNQTIMISNGKITATQRKAYNVLLHEAVQELRTNSNQITFLIPIKDIKENAGIKATDNWHLKEDLKQLAEIKVEVVKDNGDWAVFSLLSDIEKDGDLLKFVLSERIRQALIVNDYYTTLDLLTIKMLQGKHAIILYELAMRYNKVAIPKLSIDEFRKLTGTESYRDFTNLKQKVIDPAVLEINEKADITMSYTTFKLGRKVVAIKFSIQPNSDIIIDVTPTDQKAIPQTTRVQQPQQPQHITDILPEQLFCVSVADYGISANFAKSTIKKYGLSGAEKCRDYAISRITIGNVPRPGGYMAKCLREGLGLTDKPVTAKSLEKIKEAAACYQNTNGSCAAEWKNHRDNPGSNCHHCKKFENQRKKVKAESPANPC